MKIFMMISMAVSLIYTSSSHPIMLMLIILTQSSGVCIMAWMSMKTSWFSYILFLIFLGGLMVLFIYITSLASNEMILIGLNMYMTTMIATLLSTICVTQILNSQFIMTAPSITMKTFYFMYSWNSMTLVAVTMGYLLLTLIIVVKISNKFEAPLKNLIFY